MELYYWSELHVQTIVKIDFISIIKVSDFLPTLPSFHAAPPTPVSKHFCHQFMSVIILLPWNYLFDSKKIFFFY